MRTFIITLCNDRYAPGAVALLNSLAAVGYEGTLLIGYQGDLPAYLLRLNPEVQIVEGSFNLAGIRVLLKKVESDWCPTHLKPSFAQYAYQQYGEEWDVLIYFDADCVVLRPIEAVVEWASQGVRCIADAPTEVLEPGGVRYEVLKQHFIDQFEWEKWAPLPYANGGFFALPRRLISFCDDWTELMKSLAGRGIEVNKIWTFNNKSLPEIPDQDALNITLNRYRKEAYVSIKEYMEPLFGKAFICHVLTNPKPWAFSYLKHLLLTGKKPPVSHRYWWRYARGPLRAVDHYGIQYLKLMLGVILGR